VKNSIDQKRQMKHEVGLGYNKAAVMLQKKWLMSEYLEKPDEYIGLVDPSHCVNNYFKDAFAIRVYDDRAVKLLIRAYKLFCHSVLRWKLFKWEALLLLTIVHWYMRVSRPQWLEHQLNALNAFIFNTRVFITFICKQIEKPYNKIMQNSVPKMQGLKNMTLELNVLFYIYIKHDSLTHFLELTKVLQSNVILAPEYLTQCRRGIAQAKRLHEVLASKRKNI
jgi:hypothetical protein